MSLLFDCRCSYSSGFQLEADFRTSGQITKITGASGTGKSTVLIAIAGLIVPDRGEICFGERVLFDSKKRRNLHAWDREVGLVFQESLLFPHLNVRDNLLYGKKRNPSSPVSFEEVSGRLEIDPLLDRWPDSLSGGQARRVAIGRALLQGPKLLLLDEPFSGLDKRLRENTQKLVYDMVTQFGIEVIIASHDQEEGCLVPRMEVKLSQF